MPGTRARQFPEPVEDLTSGPWVGVVDARDPAAATPTTLRAAINVYREPGLSLAKLIGRPGFQQFGPVLGAVGARFGQFIGQFTKADGSTYTIVICGGRFYTLNWSTRVVTESLTAADFSGASITLAATGRIYSLTIANTIMFSDGINLPWTWDGTAHGGLTKLTNAPVLVGPIWMYFAKAMGIMASDRTTFAWSEENQPNLGWVTGGYNNAWSLAITGADPLYGGVGLNDQMYIHRARSWTSISGEVATDFKSSGTRSAVDEKVGSIVQALVVGTSVYFVDSDGHLSFIRSGGGVTPAWGASRETIRDVPRTAIAATQLVYYSPTNHLLCGMAGAGQSGITEILVFSVGIGGVPTSLGTVTPSGVPSFEGVWTGWSTDCMAMVLDGSGSPTLMHLGASDGCLYDHGNPDGAIWNDGLVSGVTPIAHAITPSALGVSTTHEKQFETLTLITASETDMTLTVDARTPNGAQPGQTFEIGVPGDRLDSTFILDSSRLAGGTAEFKKTIGVDWVGRWAEPTIQHSALDERFGMVAVEAGALDLGTDPADA